MGALASDVIQIGEVISLWSGAKAEQVLGVHGWGAKRVMISHLLSYDSVQVVCWRLQAPPTAQITSMLPVMVMTLCILYDHSRQPGLTQLLIYLAYTLLSSQNSDLARSFVVVLTTKCCC